MDERTPRGTLIACVTIIALGAGVRFFLAWTAPPSMDLKAYGIVAGLLRGNERLYEGTRDYNYAPIWSWVVAGLDHASRATGLSFFGLTRSFLSAADLGLAALVSLLARRTRVVRPWPAAALVIANPLLIWTSSVQGQFDNLSVLLLLAALLAATTRRAAPLLFLSIAVKQVTAVHPILWLRSRADALPVAAAYAAVAALFLPYAGQARAIRDHVLFYRAVPRSYGFSEFVLYDARLALPLALVALTAACGAAWRLRFHEPARACLFVFLVLLFFGPGLSPNYFVWPLALGALFGGAGYWLTTASALAWTLGWHYYGWPGTSQFMGHLVWLSVAFWGVREMRLFAGQPAASP
jgi:hypothetical protein